MPRKSLRQKTIDIVKTQLSKLKNEFLLRLVMNVEDSIEDDNYMQKKEGCMICNLLVTCIEVANTERTEKNLT